MRRSILCLALLAMFGIAQALCMLASAQPPDEAMVQLNFPKEIEVRGLVDYVSQRLKVKILYDDQIANKKINIKAPEQIPATSLLAVLESALKMKGLALVDADAPGWKRIVVTTKLPNVAPVGEAQEAIDRFGAGTAVTQAFVLKYVDPQSVDQAIKPLLTQPGSNSIVIKDSGTLIITDYASNLLKLARWIEFIDKPRPGVKSEFVQIEHLAAGGLAVQLKAILTAQAKAEGKGPTAAAVEVSHDERTNQLLLIGLEDQLQGTRDLIKSLDVPLGLFTKTYSFQNVGADRVDLTMKQLLGDAANKRLYRSAVDAEQNLLIVTATNEVHQRIEEMRKSLDVPADEKKSPLRFYKVKNLPATELLATIRSIEGQTLAPGGPAAEFLPDTNGRIRGVRDFPVPGPNRFPPPAGRVQEPVPPPALRTEPNEGAGQDALGNVSLASGDAASLLGQAQITADANTNTLIVVAPPAIQTIYAELIQQLDKRRPQVLIETRIVIIDTSDDFSLGVEVSGGDRQGAKRLFAFTSSGLSNINPVTGALSIIPGLGFNGTLVDPDVADVVVRALTAHGRARVVSAPRVLVNDNATGILTSVQEVPFTSVNASNTVATTSFAGFAEAGTTIAVTPRISEDDHLQLDFDVTLNTFTDGGGDGVPPPRQTEQVASQVTIPDGHTVIVGGLNRSNYSKTVQAFPFIEYIPVLRYLGGSETVSDSRNSLFIFIRPVILRDDRFKDLRFLSQQDARRAWIKPDVPQSEPIWIK
jgi:type II secretory pathway component GspD/PulD (secretin)